MNKIKIFVIILLLAIIGTICLLIAVNFIKEDVEIKQDVEDTKTIEAEVVSNIETPMLYYNVHETIKKYILYKQANNEEALQNILNSSSTDVLETIIKDENYFAIEEVYALDKISNMIFYTHVIINRQDVYLVVNIDYGTYAFEIYDSNENEFKNAIDGKINQKYKKDQSIKQNEYNSISKNINDISIIQMYYDNYKDLLYYDIEKSFEKIDSAYKLEKFNNSIENYKSYMSNNMNRMMESSIIEYWLEEKNGKPVYIFRDTNDNYITINVKENMTDYTIILDNYTIETEELKEKYNNLTSEKKAESNIVKIFKWINEKEYEEIYKHLDETFKQNNFSSINDFYSFMNNKFFERNVVQTAQITEQGKNYIITVNYASNESLAAEYASQTIIMQLKEGTDFVMSFAIE